MTIRPSSRPNIWSMRLAFRSSRPRAPCCRRSRPPPAVQRNYGNTEINGLPGVGGSQDGTFNSATIGATLTIPIYTGGRVSALVRQSKESLGQARIEVDVSRDQVRQAVVSAWTQYVAAQRKRHCQPRAGRRAAAGLERRHRGTQCRPAHHARCAQRPGRRHHRPDQSCQSRSATWSWRATPSSRRSAR